ncbi:hypothetical protein DVH05_007756 [Phytophthora capsici]|nr:hypothetical protein DVH05_007756 [Phytophthora capsici]
MEAGANRIYLTYYVTLAETNYFGEKWCWRTFLEKLHYVLDQGTAGYALSWLQDGSHFVAHRSKEGEVAKQLGLRVFTLHQVLETLGFECQEESDWEYIIYRHDCFVLGNPGKIEGILNHETLSPSTAVQAVVMPSVAYNSELKPLEVRMSLPDSHSQSWEVTIAPSVLPHLTFDDTEELMVDESSTLANNTGERCWGSMLEHTDEWSDPEMNSPLWWSQRSDFSSICSDDLSDIETLSQISSFFN